MSSKARQDLLQKASNLVGRTDTTLASQLSELKDKEASEQEAKRFAHLASREDLVRVFNKSKSDLVIDYDMVLLPDDLREDFDRYLSGKYVSYNLGVFNPDARITVLYHEGKSINFLRNFLIEKNIPFMLTKQEGKEPSIASRVVIKAETSALFTKAQSESLERFKRLRIQSGSTGEYSDWAGFLVFTPCSTIEEMQKAELSYVHSTDLTGITMQLEVDKRVYARPTGGVIEEDTEE